MKNTSSLFDGLEADVRAEDGAAAAAMAILALASAQ